MEEKNNIFGLESQNNNSLNKTVPLDGIELLMNTQEDVNKNKRPDGVDELQKKIRKPKPKFRKKLFKKPIMRRLGEFGNGRSNQNSRLTLKQEPMELDLGDIDNADNFDIDSQLNNQKNPFSDSKNFNREKNLGDEYADEDNGEDLGMVEDSQNEGEDEASQGGEELSDEDEDEDEDEEEDEDEDDEDEDDEYEEYAGKKWKPIDRMSKPEIMSEKYELLYRYDRLKESGYRSGFDLSQKSSLDVLRLEISKLQRMRDVQKAIKIQGQYLISFVNFVEYANKKFGHFLPYQLELDGWSESVYEDLGNYDEVFEKLYYKYKDSVDMAPELQLVSMLATSGFMFHLNKKMLDSTSIPGVPEILKRRPDIMRQIQQEAIGSISQNSQNPVFGMMGNMMGGSFNPGNFNMERKTPVSNFGQNFEKNPSPANAEINPDVSRVPRGQGQQTMQGPEGFDEILRDLEAGNQEEIRIASDIEEFENDSNMKEINTRSRRKNRSRKSNKNTNDIIDLEI